MGNATTGYEKVSTFKHKVLCKSVIICSSIMITLYDRSTNTFLTFQTANEELKSYIAENVYDEVKQLIDQDFNTIKIPRLTWDKKGKKEENQNTLDSLLKPCLPLMWYYIDVFQDYKNISYNNEHTDIDKLDEFLNFIPDGQDDAAKIVMENGKFFQIWKEKTYGDRYQLQRIFPCLSCPTKGDCSTIEVILDGDVKKECGFLGGKYKKTTYLFNGKCVWAQIPDGVNVLRRPYEDENVWELRHNSVYGYIRTVQDVPCPTVANIFEYDPQGI